MDLDKFSIQTFSKRSLSSKKHIHKIENFDKRLVLTITIRVVIHIRVYLISIDIF